MINSNYVIQSVPVFVRWIARTVGLILLILVVTIAIGEGFPNPMSLTSKELTLMAALIMILTGLALGLFHEGWGGLIVLAGYGVFWMFNDMRSLGTLNAAGLVGAAYLFCWWSDHRMKS